MLHRSCPDVRESKNTLDPGFHAIDSGFQVLDSSFCLWNLDSGFQSLMGFRIPKLRIPDSKSKILSASGFHKQKFPGIWIPLYGANSSVLPISQVN